MKKLRLSSLLFIIFLALAFTAGENDKQESAATANLTPVTAEKFSYNSYIPNIPFINNREGPGNELHIKTKSTRKVLLSGKGLGQIGVSKDDAELPPLGPGAFAYSEKKKGFIVLDNQNNRVNFYPDDTTRKVTSVDFPSTSLNGKAFHRVGLGLTVDNNGEPILLAKSEDASGRVDHKYYEVWRLQGNSTKEQWEAKQSFSFSNHKTHYAAQSLEMQPYGDDLLFKGLEDNEFHILKKGAKMTEALKGYPVKNGLLSLESETAKNGAKTISIQYPDERGKMNLLSTNEDMERLNSFRVLRNGNVAIDLEADDEKNIPREVVLVNLRSGTIKARTPIRSRQNIEVDQDLYFKDNNVFQLAESEKQTNNNKPQFGIYQTQFEDD